MVSLEAGPDTSRSPRRPGWRLWLAHGQRARAPGCERAGTTESKIGRAVGPSVSFFFFPFLSTLPRSRLCLDLSRVAGFSFAVGALRARQAAFVVISLSRKRVLTWSRVAADAVGIYQKQQGYKGLGYGTKETKEEKKSISISGSLYRRNYQPANRPTDQNMRKHENKKRRKRRLGVHGRVEVRCAEVPLPREEAGAGG